MIAQLQPSISQIRLYVETAINAFETLDVETATEISRSNLKSLSLYLEAFDNADNPVSIVVVPGVKAHIKLENLVRDGQGGD